MGVLAEGLLIPLCVQLLTPVQQFITAFFVATEAVADTFPYLFSIPYCARQLIRSLSPTLKQWAEAVLLSTARMQLGPSGFLCLSWREWLRLPFTARIERAHSYRARSASKKGTWPLPPHSLSPTL